LRDSKSAPAGERFNKTVSGLYDQTQKKLEDYDFNYIFYNANKMKYLDLAIGAINKVHKDDQHWIKKEMNTLTTSFIFKALSDHF